MLLAKHLKAVSSLFIIKGKYKPANHFSYLLDKGAYVFDSVGLSVCLFVCLFVDNITHKGMNRLG